MDELIRKDDGQKKEEYEKYESLLMMRDQLKKEANSIQLAYMKEFGEEVKKAFEEKLKCIQKKKAITFCQMALNKGKSVSAEKLKEYLEKQMEEYKKQLEDVIRNANAGKDATAVSDMQASKAKRLYRKIAKKLHPDINPMTEKNEWLLQIWTSVCYAYEHSDVEELEELNVMADIALEKLGKLDADFEIPDILKKIEKAEKEIEKISTTEPYTYKNLLRNPERVSAKHKELQGEIAEYRKYAEELEAKLQEILEKSGGLTWTII